MLVETRNFKLAKNFLICTFGDDITNCIKEFCTFEDYNITSKFKINDIDNENYVCRLTVNVSEVLDGWVSFNFGDKKYLHQLKYSYMVSLKSLKVSVIRRLFSDRIKLKNNMCLIGAAKVLLLGEHDDVQCNFEDYIMKLKGPKQILFKP